ncbi:Proteasome assembly chaperone 2 [Lobulomyces angularis]|nr:Proteasome assembly chaperone 2 [Lobulomyces angularis]
MTKIDSSSFFISNNGNETFNDCTLVMPAPNGIASIGNLCVDLLITDLKKVGYLQSNLITPIIGYDPVNLVTAMEVFQSPEKNFVFVQLRSPVLKNFGVKFSLEFKKFFDLFKEVVFLTGLDSSRRTDKDLIDGAQLKVFSQSSCQKFDINSFPPGTGLSKVFFKNYFDSENDNIYCLKNVNFKILGYFCSEGDNLNSSVLFFNLVCEHLGLKKELKFPLAWEKLYGQEKFTIDLY